MLFTFQKSPPEKAMMLGGTEAMVVDDIDNNEEDPLAHLYPLS